MKKNKLLKICFSIIGIAFAVILFIQWGKYQDYLQKKHNQEPFSIIIATDIHYLSPDYRGEYFKEPQSIFDGKIIIEIKGR